METESICNICAKQKGCLTSTRMDVKTCDSFIEYSKCFPVDYSGIAKIMEYWFPCHLEIAFSDSEEGERAMNQYTEDQSRMFQKLLDHAKECCFIQKIENKTADNISADIHDAIKEYKGDVVYTAKQVRQMLLDADIIYEDDGKYYNAKKEYVDLSEYLSILKEGEQ